jgi:hypothetical protein
MGLTFNLKKSNIPVTLQGDAGDINLMLVEMDAAARDRHMDTLTARMGKDATGAPTGGLKRFNEMQADLLVCCLRKEDGSAVALKEIQTWPASVVNQLFDEAQKQNHLIKDEKPPEKKE